MATAFAVFFLTMKITLIVVGPLACEDGYRSSSIGSRGACSHHGGVDCTLQQLAFLLSLVAGVVSWGWFRSKAEQLGQRSLEKKRVT